MSKKAPKTAEAGEVRDPEEQPAAQTVEPVESLRMLLEKNLKSTESSKMVSEVLEHYTDDARATR